MILTILTTFLATLFFAVFAFNLKPSGKRIDHQIAPQGALDSPSVMRSIGQLLGPPLVSGNAVEPLTNGDEIFPSMLAAIASAQSTITFETFIYWSGEIGANFADCLIERAGAGIKVHILLDWVGSRRFDETALLRMKHAGIEIERYRPLRWYHLARLNNRTHRKILVVDGKVGFIGGVGIADQWQGEAQDENHWRDDHFRVEGPVVAQLQAAFMDNWNATRPEVLSGDSYFPEIPARGSYTAQVFKSSPEEGSGSVRLMYLYSIAHAKRSIKIASAYFVPDSHLRTVLVAAAGRGVTVEIILPGKHIDTQLTRFASRAVWTELLSAGIRIYEFRKTMFHCKYIVIDDIWSSVGSTNLDNRSFRLNDECNLNIIDSNFAAKIATTFKRDRSYSTQVQFEHWAKRPAWEKCAEAVARLFRSQI